MFSILLLILVWLCVRLIILSGDFEVDSSLNNNNNECLSIFYWNLNSISAHDYSKSFLLKAFNSVHKLNITCLSETYFYSTVLFDDDNLAIPGHNFVCSDHLSTSKGRGGWLPCKSYLPIRVINIGCLKECLNFALTISHKSCNFVVVYRSPIQFQDESEIFYDNFETTLETLA